MKNNYLKIESIVKRYTHDKSESGYDDIMGACPQNCRQCKRDGKMLQKVMDELIKEEKDVIELNGVKYKRV